VLWRVLADPAGGVQLQFQLIGPEFTHSFDVHFDDDGAELLASHLRQARAAGHREAKADLDARN